MDLIIVWYLLAFVILGGLLGLFGVLVEAIKLRSGKTEEHGKPPKERPTTLSTRIAGVSHQNEVGPSRQVCLEKLTLYDELWLEQDPENRFDKNAVKVLSQRGQLGFLPREEAKYLSGQDLASVRVELKSKGKASNGLWGCTIDLHLPQTSAPPQTREKNPSGSGFKKDSAINAAKAGILSRSQLLAVIDQASRLGLNKEELAIFETALHKAPVPKLKSPPPRIVSSSNNYYEEYVDPTDIERDNGFDGISEYWHEYHKHD